MEIQAFFCLDAQRRGDLIDVMGAGVPVYYFDSLPHDARFPVGLLINLSPDDVKTEQTVKVLMSTPDGAPFSDGTLTIDAARLKLPEGAGHTLSTVCWMSGQVPAPGTYHLAVSSGSTTLRTLSVSMDIMAAGTVA